MEIVDFNKNEKYLDVRMTYLMLLNLSKLFFDIDIRYCGKKKNLFLIFDQTKTNFPRQSRS